MCVLRFLIGALWGWSVRRCIRVQEKKSALHYAAQGGHTECLQLLIARNAVIDATEKVSRL